MINSKPVPRRWFRLQFSLRMMLLLTAAVGVGLTIFRWPWEVSSTDANALQSQTRTVTYRRGWTGKRLKHGSERIVDNRAQQLTYEAFHFDDELRRAWHYDPPGQLKTEVSWYPEREEKRVRYFADLAREGIVREVTSWQNNQRLKREWRSYDGRLLESQVGEFVDTFDWRQLEWNGQPLDKALPLLLADLPENVRTAWLAPQSTGGMKPLAWLGDGTVLMQASAGRFMPRDHVGPRDFKQDDVLVHFANNRFLLNELDLHFKVNADTKTNDEHRPAPSLAEQLLGYAGQHDATLRCQFGVVCVVPIARAIREPADATGVLAVNFPAGSQQERDWLAPVDGLAVDVSPPSSRLKEFFAATSIPVDVTHLQLREPGQPERGTLRTGIGLRPRRDLLGLFLWHNDCRVDQQGKTLIVRRRKE